MKNKFSIILPVYNSFTVLQKVLDSLRPQLGQHELLVINDASTDDRIRPLLDNQDWLKAIHLSTNRGSSGARNEGIKNASGERILFIDADCIAAEDWIHRNEQFHECFPEEGVIGNVFACHQSSMLLRFLEYGSSPMFGLSDVKVSEWGPLSFHFFFTCNSSVPRNRLLEAGLFDERYNGAWDDIELGYRMHQQGFQFRFDPKLIIFHHHPETLSKFLKRQIRVGKGYWRVQNHHAELLGALNLKNQFSALCDGMKRSLTKGKDFLEKLHFVGIEGLGKIFFWYGYLIEKRTKA